MIAKNLHAKISVWVQKLEKFADRAWYPPLIGLLAALDNLLIVIPNDGILIASSMIVPRRWLVFALFITLGSTIGAFVLGWLVQAQGGPWIRDFFPGLDQSTLWLWTERFFNQYGLLVVFAVAATPIAQHPVIILAGLSGTPILKLTAIIFAGRLLKYLIMAYLASHSPKLLKKVWGLKDELDEAGVKID